MPPPQDDDNESRRQILMRRAQYVALAAAAVGVGGMALVRHLEKNVKVASCLSMAHMPGDYDTPPPKKDAGDQ